MLITTCTQTAQYNNILITGICLNIYKIMYILYILIIFTYYILNNIGQYQYLLLFIE